MGVVSGPVSVYSTGTRVLATAAWAFCAFFALNLVLTGTAGAAWRFLPPLLLAGWAIHLLLWRPRLLVDASGLTVVNILRKHRIPFAALKAVRVAQVVYLDTTAGRIASWGAPGAGRLGSRPGARPGSSGPVHVTPHTQAAVDAAWNAWEQSALDRKYVAGAPSAGEATGTVATRWDVGAGVVSIVLLVFVVVCVVS